MCIASCNPYSQPKTLLLEFDENLINTTTVSQDSITIVTTISRIPSKQEDTSVKKQKSRSELIKIIILVCFIPIIIATLDKTFRAQRKEIDAKMNALQDTMLRIHTLRDRQNERLSSLDKLTQQRKGEF